MRWQFISDFLYRKYSNCILKQMNCHQKDCWQNLNTKIVLCEIFCQKYCFIKFGLTPESTIVWSGRPWEYCYQNISLASRDGLNGIPLINLWGADHRKWSNTPKQLNVFDHLAGLALKGLKLLYSSFTPSSNGSVIVTKNIVVITAITVTELLLVLMCLREISQTYL